VSICLSHLFSLGLVLQTIATLPFCKFQLHITVHDATATFSKRSYCCSFSITKCGRLSRCLSVS